MTTGSNGHCVDAEF